MLVAIISDIHDNIPNLNKCLTFCKEQKIKTIICCGDICDKETLEILSANFSGKILLIDGNGETYQEEDVRKFKNIKHYGKIATEKIDNLNIGFCHQEKEINKIIEQTKTKFDFIFYGHSHKPWIEKKDNTFIANPGNISGTFFQASFAILNTNTKKLELKIMAYI